MPYPSSDKCPDPPLAKSTCVSHHDNASRAMSSAPVSLLTEQRSSWFKAPSSDAVLRELCVKKFAPSTERKIQWAVALYEEWRKQ